MSNARSIALFIGLFALACGRTEPFGTETYTPGVVIDDDADGGGPLDDGIGDLPDLGAPRDARPDLPDLGFQDLPCDGCDEIRDILNGVRWESPCVGPTGQARCQSPGSSSLSTNLRGRPGSQYEAVLRFRGVVERRTYVGGYHEGGAWQIGGGPTANARNIFRLEFTSPAQSIFLNRTDSQVDHCERLDDRLTIRFNVGTAVVSTVSTPGDDQFRNRGPNGAPIVVNGVPPAPEAYDGQFIQMSVESIRRIR